MSPDRGHGRLAAPAPDLVERALGGERRALARLISRIEDDDEPARALSSRIYRQTGRGHRVGLTGPPGAGKSSLIAHLIGRYRAAGRRVGVVAVDPTSRLTGGAALGDRIRLIEFHADPDVFIRSMASRGHAGGLAETTPAVAHVLDAAGFDPILIETLGVGQDEVEVAHLAHTVVVLQVPGLGDAVQTLKAGLLEIADILVVNKADQPGADRLARDLATMLTLGEGREGEAWSPPILRTSATTGEGVDRLVAALDEHRAHLRTSGELERRERRLVAAEISRRLRQELLARLALPGQESEMSSLIDQVVERSRTPEEVVSALLAGIER